MSFDVDVAVRRGEAEIACRFTAGEGLTVLFGPSGIGKTSVLTMIAGLLRPRSGRIAVAGRTLFDGETGVDVPVEQRRVGYVFQEPRLFPHMSVRRNLYYGAGRRGEGGGAISDDTLIEVLGIGHLLDRAPHTLSGGEARRVAIGRAMLSNPAFLLLDEPLSSLDRARREEIMVVIERMRDQLDMPMLMVTHDHEEAERLATRIVGM
ncbi:ATP-binding cassette domain-containing protein [Stakelama saccharophila]|uniref:ATP-binding cassette domain-containing protein n=1 Tax=Stakelama saccharophila TaxID=3075605 RepID=A0ABZ0B6V7_9SPHN|nr:ATP-binding cassette domain-containing protein [Stakelama sp. W311]WNO53152.1 ATP-binding cassette domain-containing protein [Stakelama sp. W311]